jgi:predicted PurR-regulated permease PerM
MLCQEGFKDLEAPMPAPPPSTIRPWIVFGGCVLVVLVLDWAEPVLLPTAIAILLTFLLNPPVTALQRVIGRPAAVVFVVSVTFVSLALLAYGLTRQVAGLAAELPQYRETIRQKVADVRDVSRGGAVEEVQSTLKQIETEMTKGEPSRPATPVVVLPDRPGRLSIPPWLTALSAPLGTFALVSVLVVFMLLEHRDMRDRLVGLFGQGYLATTTRALEEAGTRVSHYLLMQSLVNAIYGVCVGVGLWWLDVPYPLLWAALGAALRFIPYIGPWLAAGGPILITLAALPGWTPTFYVVGFFVVLELFTNMVLETVLYAGAAGVTQVALLIAVAFWTWLWGPLGLLLATPLTVCLVVLGKHVPGFTLLSTLIADRPALSPDAMLYQRLLGRNRAEAWEVIEGLLKTQSSDELYDTVLLPPLSYAERDRAAGELSDEQEREVADLTRDLLQTLGERDGAQRPPEAGGESAAPRLRILGYPVAGTSDEVALHLLARLLRELPVTLEIQSPQMLIAEMIEKVAAERYPIVCLADLPPSAAAKTRYIIKRLGQAAPQATVLVGRWGPPSITDEPPEALLDAGAAHVAQSLVQTRNQIRELAAQTVPATSAIIPDARVSAPRM